MLSALALASCEKEETQQGYASVFVDGTQTVFLFPYINHKKTAPYQYSFWARNGSAILAVELLSDAPIAPGLFTTNNGAATRYAHISYAPPGAATFTHVNNGSQPHPLAVHLTSVTANWVEGTLTAVLEKENGAGPGAQQIALTEGRFRMPAQKP
ncbi:MAG: hypothetical protein JWP69_1313 [Flaviaesturariibacter sp.]|nr:hypothetical protein [Flaviaesturariibacter sp.]